MTARVILQCDGTPTDRPGMSLESCRAFLPTTALSPLEARDRHGRPGGWSLHRGRDLCPACTRTTAGAVAA